jgi:hypothetical protein
MTLVARSQSCVMNLWRKLASPQPAARLRHDLLVGPHRHSELFGRPARLYYCVRCKWSFVVCGRAIAILDENGGPVAEESLRRFNTLAEGACPVLEAFISAALADVLRASSRSKRDEPGDLAHSHTPVLSGRPRPLLRILTRVQEEFGRARACIQS